jgi:hypothetical protein
VEAALESGTGGITQVYFASGRLWTSQGTAVSVGGEQKTGIAYYILRPSVGPTGLTAAVDLEGQFGLPNNNLLFPAVAATKQAKAVISFTIVGEDYFASAGYATLSPSIGVGQVHLIAAGLGPVDDFDGYAAFNAGDPPPGRLGDYGAAAVDGTAIWVASEYVGQSCTMAEYVTDTSGSPLFSCSGTRTRSANWATRISQLVP